jgi:FkbM family methyltransferase
MNFGTHIKKLVKATIFRSMGLYAKPLPQIPFGVEWIQDIKYLLNDRKLELVVDVGANIGQTVSEVLKCFPESCIYCFEPVPSTFECLTEQTGKLSNVFPINMALGERPSILPMIAKPLAEQNTLVFDAEKAKNNDTKVVDVKVDTLDQFCSNNNINKINLLKVDTEGYEMNVLRGAERMLSSSCIDYILIECDFLKRSDAPHGDFVEILNYLQPFQYNVVAFYSAGVDQAGWIWGNVLFRRIIDEDADFFALSPFGSRLPKSPG